MPRELNSDDIKIEQKAPIDLDADLGDREGDIVLADTAVMEEEYLDKLKFMEEPVTVRLQQNAEKNAAMAFPFWNNGKPSEVFQNGRWQEVGYLPVGRPLIIKRKILEQIIRARVDSVTTEILNRESDRPENRAVRFTSPVHSYSILKDDNPRGAAWATELMARNF